MTGVVEGHPGWRLHMHMACACGGSGKRDDRVVGIL